MGIGDPNILVRTLKDREENPDNWSSDKEYAMRVGVDDQRTEDAVRSVIMDRCKIRSNGIDLPGKNHIDDMVCHQMDENFQYVACNPQRCEKCTNPAKKKEAENDVRRTEEIPERI